MLKSALGGARILLIEDSLDNQTLIRLQLSHQGAKVLCAPDGREGILKAFSAPFPDLILLDIQMPGMDGYDTIRELREKGFTRPILALTAHALIDERRKTAAAGFNAHLTKPINPDEIIESIRQNLAAWPLKPQSPTDPAHDLPVAADSLSEATEASITAAQLSITGESD